MDDIEAINLMRACKNLATRLEVSDLEIKLTLRERIALGGFERVRLAGFNYSKLKRLAEIAGLNSGDLGMLNWACNQRGIHELLSEVHLPPSQ